MAALDAAAVAAAAQAAAAAVQPVQDGRLALVENKITELMLIITRQQAHANSQHHAGAHSRAEAKMPVISEETMRKRLDFPKDMFIHSHSVCEALHRDPPDVDFARSQADKMNTLANHYLLGMSSASHYFSVKQQQHIFPDLYYTEAKPAVLVARNAWDAQAFLQADKEAKKAAKKTVEALAEQQKKNNAGGGGRKRGRNDGGDRREYSHTRNNYEYGYSRGGQDNYRHQQRGNWGKQNFNNTETGLGAQRNDAR